MVSAASYEARGFGVHSAMSLREAGPPLPGRRLPAGRRPPLPAGEPRRHGRPSPVHAARRADLDRRGVPRRDRRPRACSATARRSRAGSRTSVRDEVGLTASVGVATTKLVAKIASDLRKPDGLVVVPPGDEAAFLAPLADLAAVGRRREDGRRPGRLRRPHDRRSRRRSRRTSSSAGSASTARRSSIARRGIDADPVHDGDPAKSVGHEHTFDVDTRDREVIERTLLAMADGVAGAAAVGGRRGPARSPSRSATRRSGRSPASAPWPSRPT